ncbi:MAG: small, acid-soluble spore protein, alpha/beta type [Bacillota bacterium]|jgi:small acid-soluble spore protein F (minor alpha/beta-type SASP)|nr:small, acid-soluble spore protein, alpha/beta type [Bacillota bacterium]HHU29291.1 small, acid-soluble spore protein, alpha/beta type [Bacillota bacterium]
MSPRRDKIMSDALKEELAEELGVADIVRREGWGGVSSRNCGNLVKLAIERAEKALMNEQ